MQTALNQTTAYPTSTIIGGTPNIAGITKAIASPNNDIGDVKSKLTGDPTATFKRTTATVKTKGNKIIPQPIR
ncbi:MAG: hypothetical protein FWD58_11305 [Firmicutes bacterium]|nr:hypothetical protein [Bacillota bacterium]